MRVRARARVRDYSFTTACVHACQCVVAPGKHWEHVLASSRVQSEDCISVHEALAQVIVTSRLKKSPCAERVIEQTIFTITMVSCESLVS